MVLAVSRCRAPCAFAAIAIVACSTAAHGQATPPAGTDAVVSAPDPAPLASGGLDPASPLAPMPDIGVEWPDLTKSDAALGQTPLMPLTPGGTATLFPAAPNLAKPAAKAEAAAARPTDIGGDRRYGVQIDGLDDLSAEGLVARFNGLSSLKQGEKAAANVAQIDRRAREDADTLTGLLRAYGYYDAEVETRIGSLAGPTLAGDQRVMVTLTVKGGTLYTFHGLTLAGVETTGSEREALVRAFAVHDGDAVNADKVNAGVAALKAALGERGYAFATVSDPDIVVDHESHRATLALKVDPGRQMRFGGFRLSGTKKVFGVDHVQRISRLHPGDRYNATRLDDLRRALIQTGLVSVVQLTPVRTADPQVVDIEVKLEPAPPRTIAATFGYGTGEGATLEVSWQHRNFFSPEGAVTFRGVAGTQEQLASAQLRRGNFGSRDQVLTAQVALDHQQRPAYDAKTATLATSIERETNIIWQKKWTYSYGVELVASDERDVIQATGQPRRRTYYVAALPLSLSYDGSDDLLNPSRGYRLSAHVSPEISFRGRPFEYVRIQLDGSAYQPVGSRIVFAERVRLGSIQGTSSDDIAPTRRFYSGGGGSVRGFGYQRIGPRDVDNDPVGGSSLAEFGLEARVRFGDFGIVPFFDGGNLYSQSLPRFTGFRYGTGLGVRYYTSFGPIRVDVGTPINRQPGDSRVAVYVSLGQAF